MSERCYQFTIFTIIMFTAFIVENLIPYSKNYYAYCAYYDYNETYNETYNESHDNYDTDLLPHEARAITVLSVAAIATIATIYLSIGALFIYDKCFRDDNDW